MKQADVLDNFKLHYEQLPTDGKFFLHLADTERITDKVAEVWLHLRNHPVITLSLFVFLLAPFQPIKVNALEPHTAPIKPLWQKELSTATSIPKTKHKPLTKLRAIYIAPRPAPAPVVVNTAPAGCGDNMYAHFIYMHESGCSTTAFNAIGCYGIGQACPASKIAHCGADYACQNAWFTQYANSAYGGWAGAYQHWLSHFWW